MKSRRSAIEIPWDGNFNEVPGRMGQVAACDVDADNALIAMMMTTMIMLRMELAVGKRVKGIVN
jgi:hypothetical protein